MTGSLMPPVVDDDDDDDATLWPVAGDAMITDARSFGRVLEAELPAVVVMSNGSWELLKLKQLPRF